MLDLALGAESISALSNLGQVVALAPEEGAKSIPVKGAAVVTFWDKSRSLLFLQDEKGAVSAQLPAERNASELELQPGQRVEYSAVTVRGHAHCNLRLKSIRALGEAALPAPIPLDVNNLLNESADSCYVKVQGYIPRLVRYGSRLTLQLLVRPGVALDLTAEEGDSPEARELSGSQVEVSGVFAVRYDSAGRKIGGRIYASSLTAIRRVRSVSVLPLAEVSNPRSGASTNEPVRMHAAVLNHNLGEFLLLRDGSGQLRLPYRELTYFDVGKQVEVFAWPIRHHPSLLLTNLSIRALPTETPAESPNSGEILTPAAADSDLRTLTRIEQVRMLSPQEASRGYPVHLSAVVTFCDLGRYLHFAQDASAGIYFDISRVEPKPALRAGNLVEIDGWSAPGEYAPIIIAQQVRPAGEAALPVAQSVTLQKMMTGSYDSQWVSIHGVVRNQWRATNVTTLALFTGNAILKVNVPGPPENAAATNYIDAAVEVYGVCTTLYDERRRLQGVELHVPGWKHLKVLEAAAADPFTLPVKSVANLFQFTPGSGDLHRTRLMGIVTLRLRDNSFYLQDATGGLQIEPQQTTHLTAGQALDVVGFPVMIDKQPVIQNAILRPVKTNSRLDPAELRSESLLEEALYGTLVWFDGRVLGRYANPTEELLTVQLGSSVIEVIFEKRPSDGSLEEILPGTVARISGVYRARLTQAGSPERFQLFLRSTADIQVLSRPPWWTVRHTILALIAALVLAILGSGWVRALRRQVKQRTRELKAEIEQHQRAEAQLEAEIAERKRMETEVERTHQQLVAASRQAGMAEVATSVLHNVGNVLNSVNVSANLLKEQITESRVAGVERVAKLLRQHADDLASFFRQPKAQQLPGYLNQLSVHLASEQRLLLRELDVLERNLDHIKQIVATQQNYARVLGLVESVHPTELVEDAVRIQEQSFSQHKIQISRDYAPGLPALALDKHKALQVLINLIRNARNACDESGRPDKRVSLRVANGGGTLKISVTDNGIGIAPENLTRIFNHGFTTRKDGHGFGLHSGALAARDLGGTLQVQSDGLGKGATFTLELPCLPLSSQSEKKEKSGLPAALPV